MGVSRSVAIVFTFGKMWHVTFLACVQFANEMGYNCWESSFANMIPIYVPLYPRVCNMIRLFPEMGVKQETD